MGFYFCGKYIYTDGDKKEVKRKCMQLSRIFGVLIIIMDMRSLKIILKIFFSCFYLTLEQKRHYAQLKLAEKAYWWWEDSHIDC